MARAAHVAGPNGERSPGLNLAIAGYLAENPPAGGGGASTLDDLTDVDTSGQTTGDVLKYNGTSWVADAASAGTVTSTDISDSTATGRAVLTAADAATARTAIGAGTSNLAIGTTGTTAAAGNRAASTTATGMVELATTAETTTGTDTTRAVTPAGVKAVVDARATDYATAAQGAKADAAVPSGLVDAKGDLIVATADNTVARLPAGTNGHVLTADSAEAAGVKWAVPAGGGGGSASWAVSAPPTAAYPQSNMRPIAAVSVVTGWLVFMPMKLSQRTYTMLGVSVSAAGTNSPAPVLRLGIYARNTDGTAGSLILDAGSVDGGTAGVQYATINYTPTSPDVYLAVVGQGVMTGLTIRGNNHNSTVPNHGLISAANGEAGSCYRQTGVTGALPATPSPSLAVDALAYALLIA